MNDSHSELHEEMFQDNAPILAAPDVFDPVLEAFKKDVDRTLLRANLRLTPEQRSRKFQSFMKAIYEVRGKANPNVKVWR